MTSNAFSDLLLSVQIWPVNNNNNTFVERHSAVASEALAEQVS